jgi:hypothetical protein
MLISNYLLIVTSYGYILIACGNHVTFIQVFGLQKQDLVETWKTTTNFSTFEDAKATRQLVLVARH